MKRRYDSFLVRYWHWNHGERRVEVEHFQSEQRTRVRSIAEAVAWIEARSAAPLDNPPQDEAESPS